MTYQDLLLFLLVIGCFLIFLLIGIVYSARRFLQDMHPLRRRLRHAKSADERAYWKREIKALYLSLIPGISRRKAKHIVHRKHTHR